ncbi:hypothetical protein INT43_001945 [Umbelopsis isabellina]|uniref:HECT-type E3 ubiquitin transferase n=1 Tax=Mortierella isabellina TaxID=91625 RepID=A0A8H7PSH4_MORIS|nr:hypothetical protein INT43_001945 [Umbelopsis isabellina]
MFQTSNEKKKEFLEKAKADRLRRELEKKQKEDKEALTRSAIRLQVWWRSRKAAEHWKRIGRWQVWNEHAVAIVDEKAPIPGQVWKCVALFWLLNGNDKLSGPTAQDCFQKVCKLMLTKMTRPGSSASEAGTIPFHAFLADSVHSIKARFIFKQTLNGCWERVTDVDHGQYLSGAELRMLLMYMSPKTYNLSSAEQILDGYWVMQGYNQNLREIANSILADISPYHLINEGAQQRCANIIKLQDRATRHSKGVISEADKRFISSTILWLTAVIRCSLFILENKLSKANSSEMAMDEFVVQVLAIPCLTTVVNDPCLNLIASCEVLSRITAGRFTRKKAQQLSSSLEADGCLFFVANMVSLYQHSLKDNKNSGNLPQACDLVQMAAAMLQCIKPYVSATQRNGFSRYHLLFGWYSTSARRKTAFPNYVYTKAMGQLEHLWSRPFMNTLFTDVCSFRDLTQPNAESRSSGFKSKFNASQLRKKSRIPDDRQKALNTAYEDGKPLAELSMDAENAFRLYYTCTEYFRDSTREIWTNVAFTKNLVPQLWKLMNSLKPNGAGLSIYMDDAKQSMDSIEGEVLLDILKGFCESAIIVFKTLDNSDLFEKQQPFTVTELNNMAKFLNEFYFTLVQICPVDEDSAISLPPRLRQFQCIRKLLMQLYDIDGRRQYRSHEKWILIHDESRPFASLPQLITFKFRPSQPSQFMTRVRNNDLVAKRILYLMPHTIPFPTRLDIFRDMAVHQRELTISRRQALLIKVRRQYLMEDGFAALADQGRSTWLGDIRVSFVNELGAEEAGIDQGGPFKAKRMYEEFISQLCTLAFSPAFGLFSSTSVDHFMFPSPSSYVHGTDHIALFRFMGKVLAKAVYEGVLVDAQFASFFLAKLLGRNVFIEQLQELDADMFRNLMFLKRYEGDVGDLCLTFSADMDFFNETKTVDLKYNGRDIPVTNDNRIEYIYVMGDYMLNQRIKEQTKAFIEGFKSIISDNWIRIFSPAELQRVISGENVDFADVSDLRSHTEYQNGAFDQHPVMKMLWQILQDFDSEDKRAFLKFVTSSPKVRQIPPLGGFEYLQPPFTIRLISLSGESSFAGISYVKNIFTPNGKDGRLPSSSTCYEPRLVFCSFNLLKLPGKLMISYAP